MCLLCTEWAKGNMGIRQAARALSEVSDDHVMDAIDVIVGGSDANAKLLEDELVELYLKGMTSKSCLNCNIVFDKKSKQGKINFEQQKYCSSECRMDLNPKRYEKRLLEQTLKTDTCWLYNGSITSAGYGQMSYGKATIYTHRLSYLLYIGELHQGMSVCHKCDNPTCINPEHLFLGTHLENMEDMVNKGRSTKKTHCPKGHEYSGKNLLIQKSKYNRCRTCSNDWTRNNRKKES